MNRRVTGTHHSLPSGMQKRCTHTPSFSSHSSNKSEKRTHSSFPHAQKSAHTTFSQTQECLPLLSLSLRSAPCLVPTQKRAHPFSHTHKSAHSLFLAHSCDLFPSHSQERMLSLSNQKSSLSLSLSQTRTLPPSHAHTFCLFPLFFLCNTHSPCLSLSPPAGRL